MDVIQNSQNSDDYNVVTVSNDGYMRVCMEPKADGSAWTLRELDAYLAQTYGDGLRCAFYACRRNDVGGEVIEPFPVAETR